MAEELQFDTRRTLGVSQGQSPPLLAFTSATSASVPANATAQVGAAIPIMMQRGWVFVPEYLGGYLSAQLSTGTAAGTMDGAIATVSSQTPPNQILRVYPATFTAVNIFGLIGAPFQATVLDEIDALEANAIGIPVLTSLSIALSAVVTAPAGSAVVYVANIFLRYHIRLTQQ